MKNTFFQAISTFNALTDNGALTNSTSLNPLVDLFFLAGACRTESIENINAKLQQAYSYDNLLTLKLIFWAGDIRGGAGERRFFKIALSFLERNYPTVLAKLIGLVPFYNRWDSLFHLGDTSGILDLIKTALQNKDALCAKWMPRQGSKKYANVYEAYLKCFKIKPRAYRKMIVGLSKTVEQQMSSKQWDKIIYQHVPSCAMNKYRTAFYRNDLARFTSYIEQVTKGEKKINAAAIFPHDIYKALKRGHEVKAIEAQWNALPNYMTSDERILPICDVSGSMCGGDPIAISVALGIYISERNKSIFKDGFITFSENPLLQYLTGTFSERVRQLEKSQWDMTTNLIAVFNLILTRSIEVALPALEMPTKLLIISDMEFNQATESKTNYELIKAMYAAHGYVMPQIVFWNVNGRVGNVPITVNDKGVALISGASPSILKSVLGGDLSALSVMTQTLNSERYKQIEAVIAQ